MTNLGIIVELRSDAELIGTGQGGEIVNAPFTAGDQLPFLYFSDNEREVMCELGGYRFSVPRAAVHLQIPERRSCQGEPPSSECN